VADFKDDLEILNYALTLELFETELYRQVVAGGRLTGDDQVVAVDFGAHEAAHVSALSQTIRKLGGTPVAPAYNYPALGTRDEIIRFLANFEQLGSGAYLAAAPEIKDPDVLAVALQIHNVEGSHASVLQFLLKAPTTTGAFATPVKKADVLAFLSPFIIGATLSPPAGGALPAPTGTGGATTTTLPQTGRARHDANNGLAAAVVAGVAAVGVGAALRSRPYKRRPTAAAGDD
jgi:rubrerythrin